MGAADPARRHRVAAGAGQGRRREGTRAGPRVEAQLARCRRQVARLQDDNDQDDRDHDNHDHDHLVLGYQGRAPAFSRRRRDGGHDARQPQGLAQLVHLGGIPVGGCQPDRAGAAYRACAAGPNGFSGRDGLDALGYRYVYLRRKPWKRRRRSEFWCCDHKLPPEVLCGIYWSVERVKLVSAVLRRLCQSGKRCALTCAPWYLYLNSTVFLCFLQSSGRRPEQHPLGLG